MEDPITHIKIGIILITIGLILLILPNIIPKDFSSENFYSMGGFLILIGIINFILALVVKVTGYNEEEYY
ncbi:MAG: hypothetical protein HWN67_09470 [Candidatus Helarchaeota archaeon]|nr:hypothetical protein [Candidatus Helarchaeota archaeon]